MQREKMLNDLQAQVERLTSELKQKEEESKA